jgi:hypothetical protein
MALALGAVRTLAIMYSPMERRMVESLDTRRAPAEAAEDRDSAKPPIGLIIPVQ